MCDTERAASLLLERSQTGQQGDRLPEDCRPQTPHQALAIQLAQIRLADSRIGGWKCGLPTGGNLVFAPILASRIYREGYAKVTARNGEARIEPEVAYILGKALPVRDIPYSNDEIDAAIVEVRLALELVDSRYQASAGLPFAELLADQLFNDGMVLGPEATTCDPDRITQLTLTINGSTSTRPARHPDGNPRLPLYWLAGFLHENGIGLEAGQAIITGSWAGVITTPASTTLGVALGELGELTVLTQPR